MARTSGSLSLIFFQKMAAIAWPAPVAAGGVANPGNLVLPAANNQGVGAPTIPAQIPVFPNLLAVPLNQFQPPAGAPQIPPPLPVGTLVPRSQYAFRPPADERGDGNIGWANERGKKHRDESAVPTLLWDSRKSQKFPTYLHTRHIQTVTGNPNVDPRMADSPILPQFFYIPSRANNVASVTADGAAVHAAAIPSAFANAQAGAGATRDVFITSMPQYQALEEVIDFVSRNLHFEIDEFLELNNGPAWAGLNALVDTVWTNLPPAPAPQPAINLGPGMPGNPQYLIDMQNLGTNLVTAMKNGNDNSHGR